ADGESSPHRPRQRYGLTLIATADGLSQFITMSSSALDRLAAAEPRRSIQRGVVGRRDVTGRARILVVDADGDTRALYRQTFALAGHDVIEAADGRDALVKALLESPRLVITETRP